MSAYDFRRNDLSSPALKATAYAAGLDRCVSCANHTMAALDEI